MVSDNMHDLSGWESITCQESDLARVGRRPSSSLTDPDGNYGTPVVYTEWADQVTEVPVLRDYRWMDGRDCEHYIPTDRGASA